MLSSSSSCSSIGMMTMMKISPSPSPSPPLENTLLRQSARLGFPSALSNHLLLRSPSSLSDVSRHSNVQQRSRSASIQNVRSPKNYTLAVRSAFSIFPNLFPPNKKKKDREALKVELLEAISPLDRGASASSEEISRVEELAQNLETLNLVKETVKSPLINGKWELLYTTSESVLKKQRPKLLRPSGPIFQAINNDTLRAQNIETWPFFNQVTANLNPLTGRRVAVKFDVFKIAGLISIKAPERARGELEITYLDEELRISRGDKGNLFILKMIDPLYRVPT